MLFTAALLVPAVAAAPKPDYAINSDKVETGVYLDVKIKADPALAANCLSEGRKWAEKLHLENVEARRSEDPDLVKWRFQRDYQFLSVIDDRYISIFRIDSWSNGNGHSIDTILWDKVAGRRISIRPFFQETVDGGPTLIAMQTAIIASLKIALEKNDRGFAGDAHYRKQFEPTLLRIGPVSLASSTRDGKSSGLIFHYGPSLIGGYDVGLFRAFVPWQTLKPYLTPEGARIFGGARPKSDADGTQ